MAMTGFYRAPKPRVLTREQLERQIETLQYQLRAARLEVESLKVARDAAARLAAWGGRRR
jgi:hypothetical protein